MGVDLAAQASAQGGGSQLHCASLGQELSPCLLILDRQPVDELRRSYRGLYDADALAAISAK